MHLYEMVGEKEFRQDLIYRINTVEITLPPLRERKADIPLLVTHFLKVYNEKYQRDIPAVPPDIIQRLQAYTWPGNVRELQHAIERSVIMEDWESLIPHPTSASHDSETPTSEDYNLEEVEKNSDQKRHLEA